MIFEDPTRRRWRRAVVVFALLVAAALGVIALFVVGQLVPPSLGSPFRSHRLASAATADRAPVEAQVHPKYTKEQIKRIERIGAEDARRLQPLLRAARGGAMPLPAGVVVAFVLDEDPDSVADLERRLPRVDVVVPDWFEIPGPGCDLTDRVDEPTQRVLQRAKPGSIILLPRLANLSGGTWSRDQTRQFLLDPEARACLIQRLLDRLVALGAGGINVDFEALEQEDSEPFLDFLVDLRRALHARNMRLTVDVPFHDDAYDVEFIGNAADAVMVMAYDEYFTGSEPGPIASRDWLADSLDEILPRLPRDRVVVVVGAYGYDWDADDEDQPAHVVSFHLAMSLARDADAQPVFELGAENGHFAYADDHGDKHEVWFEDALAAWNQLHAIGQRGVSRVGLWSLGSEDPTLWSFFDAPPPVVPGALPPPIAGDPQVLSVIPSSRITEVVGQGNVLAIRDDPQSGQRELSIDPDGHIERAVYTRVPSGLLAERRGEAPQSVVLTFDDGPDARWTPALLDALNELHAPATFFVVGDQTIRHPELVEREAREGYLVGNHSWSHPHLDQLTPDEVRAEFDTTERLLEGLTGWRTPLFRVPYESELDTDDPETLKGVLPALEAGYVVVDADVDSEDWERPGVAGIVQHVETGVAALHGGVVVMHDGGGDRSETVAAVRRLVPELRAQGYNFISLDQYLGVPRTELEQPVPPGDRVLAWGGAVTAHARSTIWTVLSALFLTCTLLAILRILLLGALALRDLRRRRVPDAAGLAPLVSVLVPAYNEAKVITRTIESLLASDHVPLEIVVVDDGSTDGTGDVVEQIAAREPRVRLVRQANGGKAAAANHGLREARGEIVVAVDADTLIPPDSIPKLVRHFVAPEVTAVCGNVEVGNVNGVLTAFQAVEYVTSQNFDRRAFAVLNCISVVPGALGAWRRQAVLDAGGYSRDTLTEDADLTLTILRRGGRVTYEPEAVARTEAPETLRALLRQRFRWTYGTYQCLAKHRRAFFHGTLGWVGLPNMVLFQILFPALSPIGDAVMVFALATGNWTAFLSGYIAFLVLDLCGSLLAFTLDHKPRRWLLLLLIQRFVYRQIMYYVSLRAMVAALRGARHGWRKLDRTGSVTTPAAPAALPRGPGAVADKV